MILAEKFTCLGKNGYVQKVLPGSKILSVRVRFEKTIARVIGQGAALQSHKRETQVNINLLGDMIKTSWRKILMG